MAGSGLCPRARVIVPREAPVAGYAPVLSPASCAAGPSVYRVPKGSGAKRVQRYLRTDVVQGLTGGLARRRCRRRVRKRMGEANADGRASRPFAVPSKVGPCAEDSARLTEAVTRANVPTRPIGPGRLIRTSRLTRPGLLIRPSQVTPSSVLTRPSPPRWLIPPSLPSPKIRLTPRLPRGRLLRTGPRTVKPTSSLAPPAATRSVRADRAEPLTVGRRRPERSPRSARPAPARCAAPPGSRSARRHRGAGPTGSESPACCSPR